MPILKNTKYERFCQEVLKGATQHDAVYLAGYKPMTKQAAYVMGATMMKKPVIATRIAELREQVLPRLNQMRELEAEKSVLDRAWVLNRLMKNAEIAMGDRLVKLKLRKRGPVPEGQARTEDIEYHERDANAANKALELLGKTSELRMFTERVENGAPGDFDRMSEDDLRRYLAQQEAALEKLQADRNGTKH